MEEKETINTIINEVEDNPYTVKAKIDVLEIVKNMPVEEQEQLIDWFIQKINEKQKGTLPIEFIKKRLDSASI